MKKRIIAAILSAAMVITGITACSSETPAASSQTTTSESTSVTTTIKAEESSAPEESKAETSKAEETTVTSAPETTTVITTAAPETSAATEATTKAPETKAPETTTAKPVTTTTTAATTTKKPETAKPVTTTAKPQPQPAPQGSSEALTFAQNLIPGWNLGNQLEASSGGTPSETAWGNPKITEKLIQTVKAQGFKSIRIPVSYLKKIGNGPDYTIDAAWLDRVQEVVDMCVNNGIYAIINIHGDGYHSVTGGWLLCNGDDQKTIKAKYEKVWAQIAEKFKNYDEHLIFESMNEVFDGNYGAINNSYYKNINDYNQIFVDTVRKSGGNNAKRYLLVPGWNTDIDSTVAGSAFVVPTDSAKRVMVSVHYYAPYEFCLKESASGIWRWGNEIKSLGKSIKRNNEDFVDAQFDKLVSSFISKGIPVIIGEYGSIDKTYSDKLSTVYRAYFAEYVNYAATKRGIVTVLWDNGYNGKNGFAVFDRNKCSVTQPEIISAIMKGIKANYTIIPPTV